MDWKLVSDAINQTLQFKKGVDEGMVDGAKSMAEGFIALPGLVDKAKMATGEFLVRTATEREYREQIFDRAAQLTRETKDFGANMVRDPVGMTTAGYENIMAKVAQGRQAYGVAVAAAEEQGRLGEFYGKIAGRGGFEVAAMVVPVSKLGLAGKAGAAVKAGEELANAAKVVERAEAAAKVLTPVEAAAEVGAQFSKRKFGMVAKCPEAADAAKSVAVGATRDVKVAMTHRTGNSQVLIDGQRWNIPGGRTISEVPELDSVGNTLQRVTDDIASTWNPRHHLSVSERRSIAEAREAEVYWKANLLEKQAKGRWIESKVKNNQEIKGMDLQWMRKGVDATDPITGLSYDIMSGSESNIIEHAKRMHDVLFRMITF